MSSTVRLPRNSPVPSVPEPPPDTRRQHGRRHVMAKLNYAFVHLLCNLTDVSPLQPLRLCSTPSPCVPRELLELLLQCLPQGFALTGHDAMAPDHGPEASSNVTGDMLRTVRVKEPPCFLVDLGEIQACDCKDFCKEGVIVAPEFGRKTLAGALIPESIDIRAKVSSLDSDVSMRRSEPEGLFQAEGHLWKGSRDHRISNFTVLVDVPGLLTVCENCPFDTPACWLTML